jgi:serine/threonine protein kinase
MSTSQELQFEERIGIGSYSEVYSGQWRGTDVAIKRLHSNQFQSPEAVAEFRAEVQMLRTLRSVTSNRLSS